MSNLFFCLSVCVLKLGLDAPDPALPPLHVPVRCSKSSQCGRWKLIPGALQCSHAELRVNQTQKLTAASGHILYSDGPARSFVKRLLQYIEAGMSSLPLDTQWVISDMLFPASVLTSTVKIKVRAGRKNSHNNTTNLC